MKQIKLKCDNCESFNIVSEQYYEVCADCGNVLLHTWKYETERPETSHYSSYTPMWRYQKYSQQEYMNKLLRKHNISLTPLEVAELNIEFKAFQLKYNELKGQYGRSKSISYIYVLNRLFRKMGYNYCIEEFVKNKKSIAKLNTIYENVTQSGEQSVCS